MEPTSYEALRTRAAWLDLSERGKVRVIGTDAARLLHAMCSNNIRDLQPGTGLYAFFLNDKGRIMADANIFRVDDEFWLDTEAETGPRIYHHLNKYIIADDAEAINDTSHWFGVGIEGPESRSALEQLGFPVPENPLQILRTDTALVARASATGQLGYRIWTPTGDRPGLWERLKASKIPQAFEDEREVVRLENGLPVYGPDISERYLVQETQALHAVHFSKGCYLGQEIVERVRSRGQVHRLLTPIRIEGTVPPAPGVKLVPAKPVLDDSALGEITSAAYSPALNEVVAMAYIRAEAVAQKAEMLVAGTDPGLRVRFATAEVAAV